MPIQTDRAPDSQDDKGAGTDDQRLIAGAVKRFARAYENEALNRQEAMEDDKFKAGDQWPEQIRSDRTIQRRPCLTINKMATFVHQIVNEHRMNRPAINISPVGDKADPETAKILKGVIRQIERCSHAENAYDWGFETAVIGGWGFWRILSDYEDSESFDQVLKVERISNRFSVYMDPLGKSPEGRDAQWCFISDFMTREEFKREYPKADPLEWTEYGTGDYMNDWSTQTQLRIAEYFYFETKKRKLLALKTGHIGFEDELDPSILAEIKADPSLIASSRESEVRQLKWCKLTGKEVLECADMPGKWIPVVRIIGDETVVEGKVNYSGTVRHAKDPQRMYNYWSTAETELIALQPKAPWIMEEGQIEGHEKRWQQANNVSMPYLLYKGVNVAGKQAPAPQRQPFAGSPDGVVKAKIGAAQDMQATTGVRFDATLQERMNDESGAALEQLKRIGEMGQYHFTDNFTKSLRFTGEIFIDLLKYYYDTKRVLTIIREDNTEEQVTLDPTHPQAVGEEKKADGSVRRIFNPKVGRYDVTVTTGPNYATKRLEAAEQELTFLKLVPQAAPLVADIIAKNMDWPDADIISERLASQLPPNLLQKDMQNMPPQARALVGSLSQQLQKLSEEHKQALNLLGEKQTEAKQEQQKIDNQKQKNEQDFEAKLAKVAADMQTGVMGAFGGIEQKMQDLALSVQEFDHRNMEAEDKRQSAQESMAMERERMDHEKAMAQQEVQAKSTDADSGTAKAMMAMIDQLKAMGKKKVRVKSAKKEKGTDGKTHFRLKYDDDTERVVPLH